MSSPDKIHDVVFDGIQKPFIAPNKANIGEWSASLIEAVESGFIDPFEAHIRLKAIMQACDIALKATEESAMKEARKHGKSGSYLGNDYSLSEGRANYKFDNSPAIIDMEAKLKAAKELAKTLSKTGSKGVADMDTGEIIEPARVEYGKETITITFK